MLKDGAESANSLISDSRAMMAIKPENPSQKINIIDINKPTQTDSTQMLKKGRPPAPPPRSFGIRRRDLTAPKVNKIGTPKWQLPASPLSAPKLENPQEVTPVQSPEAAVAPVIDKLDTSISPAFSSLLLKHSRELQSAKQQTRDRLLKLQMSTNEQINVLGSQRSNLTDAIDVKSAQTNKATSVIGKLV